MSERIFDAMGITRSFLFERVYLGQVAEVTREAVESIVGTLLEHFAEEASPEADDPKMQAVDYVAGMTDRFAIRTFESLVEGPSPALAALG